MELSKKIDEFVLSVQQCVDDNTFVKLSLGNYRGREENLKNIYVKRISIKNEEKLSFTYRYKTRDIVKNYSFADALKTISDLIDEQFYVATLFSTTYDLSFENFYDKKIVLRKNAPINQSVPSLEHDRNKNRLIGTNEKTYLTELKITDQNGKVLANSQDKGIQK